MRSTSKPSPSAGRRRPIGSGRRRSASVPWPSSVPRRRSRGSWPPMPSISSRSIPSCPSSWPGPRGRSPAPGRPRTPSAGRCSGRVCRRSFGPTRTSSTAPRSARTGPRWPRRAGTAPPACGIRTPGTSSQPFRTRASRSTMSSSHPTGNSWPRQAACSKAASGCGTPLPERPSPRSPSRAPRTSSPSAPTAGVWDALSGRRVADFGTGGRDAEFATFSQDGRLVAVSPGFFVSGARHILVSSEGRVGIFDALTGRLLNVLPPNPAVSARFSPDGQRIAVTSGRTVTVWSVANGKLLAMLRASGSFPLEAEWSRDGKLLVTAEDDGLSHGWDVRARRVVATLRGHGGPVLSARFSPDGRLVVTASVDHTARVWSVATGKQIIVLRGDTDWVFDARFGPDGRSVVTGSGDGTARVWDVESPPGGLTLSSGGGPVFPAVFTPDGRLIVTGTGQEGQRLGEWDALTGHLERTLCCHVGPQVLAMSPNGHLVGAALGRMEAFADVWDLRTGRLIFHREPGGPLFSYFNDIAFDAEGHLLLAGSNATATLWDAGTGRRLRTLGPGAPGQFPDLISAQPGPRGRVVTEVPGHDVEIVRLYGSSGDLPERVIRTDVPGQPFGHGRAIFSPDGRLVLATGHQMAALLDAASGDEVARMANPVPAGKRYEFLTDVLGAFSPDGRPGCRRHNRAVRRECPEH